MQSNDQGKAFKGKGMCKARKVKYQGKARGNSKAKAKKSRERKGQFEEKQG
jgi:hypothetical protein